MTAITPETRLEIADQPSHKKSLTLLIAAILTLSVGFGAMAGGVFGAWYTWDQAVAQDIVTPDDAVFPNTPVRGPLSMWAQADIINHHQLDRTGGLYYSQMEREVPAVDESGQPILDENGEQVMVPNEARASWITATALTTALSLGVVSYALAAFAFVTGLTLVTVGFVFLHIRRKAVLL